MAEEKQPNEETTPEAEDQATPETSTEGGAAEGGAADSAAGARKAINNNSPVVMVVAVVVLAAAIGFIWFSMQKPTYEPQPVYFYDLGSGELFEGMSNDVPPIASASGADQGVRAHVYSCGSCADPSQRFIAYLETYSADAKAAMSGEATDDLMMDPSVMDEGHLVKRVDDEEWVSSMSEEGMMVMETIAEECGEMVQPTPCMP